MMGWQNYKVCSQLGTVAEVTSWNDNAEFKDMHAAYLKLGFSEQQRKEVRRPHQSPRNGLKIARGRNAPSSQLHNILVTLLT